MAITSFQLLRTKSWGHSLSHPAFNQIVNPLKLSSLTTSIRIYAILIPHQIISRAFWLLFLLLLCPSCYYNIFSTQHPVILLTVGQITFSLLPYKFIRYRPYKWLAIAARILCPCADSKGPTQSRIMLPLWFHLFQLSPLLSLLLPHWLVEFLNVKQAILLLSLPANSASGLHVLFHSHPSGFCCKVILLERPSLTTLLKIMYITTSRSLNPFGDLVFSIALITWWTIRMCIYVPTCSFISAFSPSNSSLDTSPFLSRLMSGHFFPSCASIISKHKGRGHLEPSSPRRWKIHRFPLETSGESVILLCILHVATDCDPSAKQFLLSWQRSKIPDSL